MAGRILDMGDILSIAEKVENVVSEDEANDLAKKMKKGDYTLEDFFNKHETNQKTRPFRKFT